MEKHALHVSIIGGGIRRLPTAAALQCQGIGAMVFERNLELREIGAGLTKWGSWPPAASGVISPSLPAGG